MKILFVTPELAPWVKTGGLGDMAASILPALHALKIDVRVLIPCYPALREFFPKARKVATLTQLGGQLPDAILREAVTEGGVKLLLLDHDGLYKRPGSPYVGPDHRDWPDNDIRFGLLARVAAWLGSDACTLRWKCDIVHCNDWQTALTPAYLRYLPRSRARSIVTIHNLAFQGNFGYDTLARVGLPPQAWRFDSVEHHGHLSFLKAGLQHADMITTVSPTYAREIQTDAEGMGLAPLLRWRGDELTGILNGIDTAVWNPTNDPFIAVHYDAKTLDRKAENKRELQRELGLDQRSDIPLLSVVSRLTHQKGLDLLPAITDALTEIPMQLAILGSGEAALQQQFLDLAQRHPGRFATKIGFDERLAHRIEAGADLFLMPSRFEPCGLNQMYSLCYGTPPIVRATGGLADTVVDCNEETLRNGTANGFSFRDPTSAELLATVQRAVAAYRDRDLWRRVQRNGMGADFGWQMSARQYVDIYHRLMT